MKLILSPAPPAPLRVSEPDRPTVRVALVQNRWSADRATLLEELADGIRIAAENGAKAVFLTELTLRKYPGNERATGIPKLDAEHLTTGETFRFAAEQAKANGVIVHASLFERPADDDQPSDARGYNTAILVGPDGELVGRTRKTHIPISDGYFEDTYFRPGPALDAYPVYAPAELDGAKLGLPTCWDEWFPEVARSYALAGAEILVYPTAIGSEPSFPGFDTQPIWQHVIVGNGITSGSFMIVPNRYGNEGDITFYGSSFISDPYGRILAQAPRHESAVLVADLDLGQREEWLHLFPFFITRRPDTYAPLTAPLDLAAHSFGAQHSVALGGA